MHFKVLEILELKSRPKNDQIIIKKLMAIAAECSAGTIKWVGAYMCFCIFKHFEKNLKSTLII